MARIAPFLMVAALSFATLASAENRVLDLQHPAAGVKTVALDVGVGDIEIRGTDSDTIRVQVELKPKKELFRSSRRVREMIDDIEISARMRDDTLYLQLEPDPDGDDLTEDWWIEMPRRLALSVDAGVGDLDIEAVEGAIDIDMGVGDIEVLEAVNDVNVDCGVGSIEIRGVFDAFGSIDASSGVGDASLRTPEGRERGSGFIGRSLESRGPGRARINIDAGVGDATIYLR